MVTDQPDPVSRPRLAKLLPPALSGSRPWPRTSQCGSLGTLAVPADLELSYGVDRGIPALAQLIAWRYGSSSDRVVVTHGAQGLHASLAAGQATAGGDHVVGLEGERLHRLRLQPAKRLLAVLEEDLGNGAAVARDDHVVRLDEAPPQTAREQATARRLSGSHEPDEHDVARHRPHLIRARAPGLRHARAPPR